MNFTELARKLKEIQDGGDLDIESAAEMDVEECGGDMEPMVIQGDNSSSDTQMNISISSKGVDGIRDLMDILKGISGSDSEMASDDEEHEIVIGDDFKNAKHNDKGPKVHGLDSVIFTGDDLASKGRGAVKANGGENPFKLQHESLVNQLSSLYEDIKARPQKKR